MKKAIRHPEDMTAAELADATRDFEMPFAFRKARPMNAAQRAEERSLRRGRPRIGEGVRKISVSLERNVVDRTDALARKRGVKRSQLIARFVIAGLRNAG